MFYATESRNFVVYKKGRQKISRISRTAACSHEVPQQPAVGDRHCSTTAIPTPRQGPAASRKSSQHLRELTTSKQSKQQKKKNSTYLNARLRELLNSISTGRSAVPAVMALMSASQILLQPAGEGSHHQTAALTPLGSLTPKMSRMASCLCTHRHTALTQATTVLFCCLLSLHTSLGHRTLLGSL